MVAMKFYVYITPSSLHRQLVTEVDLPTNSIGLPSEQLAELVRATIAPITPTGPSAKSVLFNDFTVDGLREKGRVADVPIPAWLNHADTRSIFEGHHPMVGPVKDFLWREFFNSLFGRHWLRQKEWVVNDQNLGYPVLDLSEHSALDAKFGTGKARLRDHLPPQWTVMSGHNQGHLSTCHPGVLNDSMAAFLEFSPRSSNLFPARTHPLFYVALYEFWAYLSTQPIWAHPSSMQLVDGNMETAEFNAQTMLSLGLAASTNRWGWWALLSHIFAPRSRALDILAQYHPECYIHGHLSPRPENLELDETLASPPPRLRILNNPYGRV